MIPSELARARWGRAVLDASRQALCGTCGTAIPRHSKPQTEPAAAAAKGSLRGLRPTGCPPFAPGPRPARKRDHGLSACNLEGPS